MDFARRQLEKYGWKDGQGLGKDLTGISKPLKPGVKLNQCGIGYDLAEEFTHHWWEDAFNNACGNLSVEQAEDGIKVATNAPSSEISAVKRAQIERDRLQYGSFIKRETMTKSGSILAPEEKDDPIEEAKNKLHKLNETLTDEQLFEACGRLTAHKGARHGLTLSGKLQRVKEQEEAFLKAYQSPTHKERPKKKDSSSITLNASEESLNRAMQENHSEPCEEIIKKSKKKKKKYDEKESSIPEMSFTNETRKKKRKKHNELEEEPRKTAKSEDDKTELMCDNELTKKRKKKHRHSMRDDDYSAENCEEQAEKEESECDIETTKTKKEKKKKKSDSSVEQLLIDGKKTKSRTESDALEDVCEDNSAVKSKKKKRKKSQD